MPDEPGELCNRRPAMSEAIEAEVAGIEPTGRGSPVPLVLKTRGATRPRSPPGRVYHASEEAPARAVLWVSASDASPDAAGSEGAFGSRGLPHAAIASVTAR